MIRIKVDDYDLKVVINGLYQMRANYFGETRNAVDDVLLSVMGMCKQMKPGRKKKLFFEPSQIKVICRCLLDWCNAKIASGDDVAVEVIGETMLLFSK